MADTYAYWPPGARFEETIPAFIEAYTAVGYQSCSDEEFDPALDKVALYADAQGKPTHAARQLDDLCWSSKVGILHLICHPLRALEGEDYGSVAVILSRPRVEGDPVSQAGCRPQSDDPAALLGAPTSRASI
jgi:hypothetical protein